MFRKICSIALALLLILEGTLPVLADEISVSGNGEGSNNGINVSSSNTQSVEQNNTAAVDNNVSVDANTGDNSASNNTGGYVAIDTGNITANVNIENSANASSVTTECCPEDITAKISGNGENSTNNISIKNNSSNAISINNTATINNNEKGTANTGENNTNNNTGANISIKTGSIFVNDPIINAGINVYSVNASAGGGNASISIINNGSGSTNSVSLINNNTSNVNIANFTTINNNARWDLNTGRNNANGNTGGGVSIVTGDITFIATIVNGPINVGVVDIDCCQEGGRGPDDMPPPPPVTPDEGPVCPPVCPPLGNGKDKPRDAGKGGEALAAALGAALPVTGGNFTLLLLLFAHGLMFFLGWYLRIHSGRAPNYNFTSARFI